MTTRFYVNGSGNYLGGFDGAAPPEDSIEVPSPPADARQHWNGASFDALPVSPGDTLAQKLAAGLAVTSTGTPAVSATYALDATTLDQIRALATDAKAGLGFPDGQSTFAYPDADGTPRTFDTTSIVNLYVAMRAFVFALNTTRALLEAGQSADWPGATATIA